jgi:hypothetical protein
MQKVMACIHFQLTPKNSFEKDIVRTFILYVGQGWRESGVYFTVLAFGYGTYLIKSRTYRGKFMFHRFAEMPVQVQGGFAIGEGPSEKREFDIEIETF